MCLHRQLHPHPAPLPVRLWRLVEGRRQAGRLYSPWSRSGSAVVCRLQQLRLMQVGWGSGPPGEVENLCYSSERSPLLLCGGSGARGGCGTNLPPPVKEQACRPTYTLLQLHKEQLASVCG